MQVFRVCVLTVLAFLTFGVPGSDAARDIGSPKAGPRLEVLVLEVRNCYICGLVKQNVQPLYEQSTHARDVPMRYVDITSIDEQKLGLRDRVQTVPTIVLMQDGVEVDRITGYMAPDVTVRALGQMIGNAD